MWSRDRKWIAFDRTLPVEYAGIYIMETTGWGTHSRKVAAGRMPCWSSNSTRLLYVGLYQEIYRVNINDTLPPVRLTSWNQVNHDARDNRSPRYSPDGTKIAFWSKAGDGDGDLWLMDTTGNNAHRLTQEGTDYVFAWDTSGTRIYYTSYRADDWTYNNGVLCSVNVQTGERKQLTLSPDSK